MTEPSSSWINAATLNRAGRDSFLKLDPRLLWKNPVMFVTAAGALLSTIVLLDELVHGKFSGFVLQISL